MVEEERLCLKPEEDSGVALVVKRQDRYRGGSQKKKEVRCFKCNQIGHYQRDCKKRNRQVNSQGGALVFDSGDRHLCAEFVGDSGATDHFCNDPDVFESLLPFTKRIRMANGESVEAEGKGTVLVRCFDGRDWIKREMLDVLYVPTLKYNLFSLTKTLDRGYHFVSTAQECKVMDGERVVVMGERRSDCFIMKMQFVRPRAMVAKADPLPLTEWHQRFAHQNVAHVREVLNRHGIKFRGQEIQCEACIMGKLARKPFPPSDSRAEKCGDLIHADVCGPMQKPSLGGAKYFLLLKDDFSNYRSLYFLKSKELVAEKLAEFLKYVGSQFGHRVKVIRSDNGTEFVNSRVSDLMKKYGIHHQTSVPYSPQQNGRAERDNRTIVEATRTSLIASGLGLSMWAEAASSAAFVINRTGCSSVKGKTPFELWCGEMFPLDRLQVFGRTVYCHVPAQQRRKLDPKGYRGVFVGYSETQKGYRVLTGSNKVETVRDLVFENPSAEVVRVPTDPVREEVQHAADDEFFDTEESVSELNQSICGLSQGNIIPARLRSQNKEGAACVAAAEPLTYKDALECEDKEKWLGAMEEEMKSLIANKTWELVEFHGQPLVDNRWVYKAKLNSLGGVDRFKARLVARGFTQRPGVDYWETYSPVIRMESLRAMLAIASKRGYHIKQFDVKTAFLYGELQEDIFMRQPVGFCDGTERVCKLLRSIYGLKQAARCWNVKFVKTLNDIGLVASEADPCVFLGRRTGVVHLGIYVDDGLVSAECEKDIDGIMKELSDVFTLSRCEFGLFLGMELRKTERGITLSQRSYSERIIARYRMDTAHPVSTPCSVDDPGSVISPNSNFPYREAVGSLNYLAVMTRPDISYAVGMASRHLDDYTDVHVGHVKRILRYVKGTTTMGLLLGKDCDLKGGELRGYSDSDYAGCISTRRSTSGYVFFWRAACISWRSERQRIVATSTTEAEYIAASEAVKELCWLKRILSELLEEDVGAILHLDNQGSIKLVENPVMHRRTKHIDVRYHFIREKFQEGLFKVVYVNTKEQSADVLTKGLNGILHWDNLERLGLEIN